jgi:putative drug exporter of the RND superfamily
MAEGVLARVGRWCFRRRWWVLAVWVVAVGAGVLASGPVFNSLADGNNPKHVESIDAYDVVNTGNDTGGQIIGLVDGVDPAAPEVRQVVTAVAADIAALPEVKTIEHPYVEGQPAAKTRFLLANDGRGLLVVATLVKMDRPARNAAIDRLRPQFDRLADRLHEAGLSQARVRLGGNSVLNREANQAVQQDLSRAELTSLPLTLVVLVLVFGGLIAAGLPVITAIVSVAASMTVLFGFTKLTDIDNNAVTVVTLLGLGLSVDYGLLLVGRYREELGAGFAPDVAAGRAWATAGRTIMFSALTVAAALTGLLMFGLTGLSTLGAAGVSIALVAMLAGLTLTAALLGVFRRWIKPSKRAMRRLARYGDAAEIGFFARLSRVVQRRPLVVAVGTAAVLLVAGAPLLTSSIRLPQLQAIPRTIVSAQVADELASRFGRAQQPAVTVVARTDPATLDAWAASWTNDPAVASIRPAEPAGPGVSLVHLNVKGESQGDDAQALVHRLRTNRPAGMQSWVTGDAAVLVDLMGVIKQGLPAAIAVTLLGMVVLLFAMTGSVVVPIKAVLANVVSLGATFGVLNAVFERGWLSGVLDTLTVGGLDPFVIVIVFGFAFGLSMDYEVFLLGRIKEYVERGWDTDTAVRRGLQHTGRIITSAALLMVIVFGAFAAARMGAIEEIGLGLAVAVLIDATIVRCLLVPATMTLLGRWNWWAPAPLARLHARIGLREHPLPEPPVRPLPVQRTPADDLASVTP